MHGTIIVMCDQSIFQDGNYYSPWEDYELRTMIPGCDYVIEDEPSELEEALTGFAMTYSLPPIPTRKLNLDGELRDVGVLSERHVALLKEALARSMGERIKRVQAELNKPEPSLWDVAYEAYNFSPFYFVSPTLGMFNEVQFYQTLKDGTIWRVPFYITETFRYHV